MSDPFRLAGKRILVTGGTRGIGRAISLELAEAGAEVIANFVRRQEDADSLAAEAADRGLAISLCRADLTARNGLEALEEALDAAGGTLSGLVHCAATGVHKPLDSLTTRHFDWTFALNVRAFLELVTRLLPRFGPGASIVAVSSAGAQRAVPAYTLVGSSKGALEAMARHMAAELAPRGIRVNILSPGAIDTDAWQAMPDGEARLEAARSRTPTGTLATPQDVARAARFLCCDAASAIVGATLIVDGGANILA